MVRFVAFLAVLAVIPIGSVTGQSINKRCSVRATEMAEIETYVLENTRKAILSMAESHFHNFLNMRADMEALGQNMSDVQTQLASIQMNFIGNKVLLEMRKQNESLQFQKLSSEITSETVSQLIDEELSTIVKNVKVMSNTLFNMMGRVMENQEKQTAQQKILSKLKSDFQNFTRNTQRDLASINKSLSTLRQEVEELKPKQEEKLFEDCYDIFKNGTRTNGIYTVSPGGATPFQVLCDMDDGGWTILQKRKDGSENFTRPWSDYVNGFGDLDSEFWLGLERIHLLTSVEHHQVKFDFQLINDSYVHAWYTVFFVRNAASEYTLSVSGHKSGLKERTFTYNDGHKFSTYDRDNKNGCAKKRNGGWWYDNCTYLNINGKYNLTNSESGMTEHCCGSSYNNFKKTIMKIR